MKIKSLMMNSIPLLNIWTSISYGQNQWGLKAIGWEAGETGQPVVVAIVDTGVDLQHPGLADRMWVNPGESGLDKEGRSKSCNGIDDDQNGFIDDVNGWNFVDKNNNVADKHGHGTHIAGIIGSHGRVQGVSSNVKIMALRYFDSQKHVDLLDTTVKAIEYAIRNGARIINYSAGGGVPSTLEESVIKLALKHKVLIVAAAGNDAADTDRSGFFPASYAWPNILSVASIGISKTLSRQSNFGLRTVRMAAPGEEILSLLPNGKFGLMSGTSQATAFVTGAAAEILAHSSREIDPIQLVDRLISSGTEIPALRGRTQEATMLNFKRAMSSQAAGISVTGLGLVQ